MTTRHEGSVHIDAPVETVFAHVEDPRNFMAALPWTRTHPALVTDISLTPQGVGSTWAWKDNMFGVHVEAVSTREQYIPNQRIVDRHSTGPLWTFIFEPDSTGTTLALTFEYSAKVPWVDKAVDRALWDGDRDLAHLLTNLKKAIET